MGLLANVIIDGVKYNYHVTEDGRVFSLDYNHTGKAKELKNNINRGGYRYVVLCKEGNPKCVQVAKLVALAYVPNPNNKPEVDHINRIRTDDRVENLRWATRSEQNYNRKVSKNNKNSKAVICVETGIIYPSTMEVKRQLGFEQGYISACCRGKRKSAYGFHWQYV